MHMPTGSPCTNTELNPLKAMLCYNQTSARNLPHLPQARHVFCNFLALVPRKALEDRIRALGCSIPGPRLSPISTR
jgi:hypothetical protein